MKDMVRWYGRWVSVMVWCGRVAGMNPNISQAVFVRLAASLPLNQMFHNQPGCLLSCWHKNSQVCTQKIQTSPCIKQFVCKRLFMIFGVWGLKWKKQGHSKPLSSFRDWGRFSPADWSAIVSKQIIPPLANWAIERPRCLKTGKLLLQNLSPSDAWEFKAPPT